MTSDDIVKRLELRSIEANDTIEILYKQLNDICALNNKNISDLSNTLLEELKDIEFQNNILLKDINAQKSPEDPHHEKSEFDEIEIVTSGKKRIHFSIFRMNILLDLNKPIHNYSKTKFKIKVIFRST